MKSAILLGATGLTGGYVLNLLLSNNQYNKVIVFSRRYINIKHDKLQVIICDLLDLEEQRENFKADEVYVCIGTTTNKTPNKTLYRDIDFGIPVTAAQLCRENMIDNITIMSSLGANANSTVFYPKIKGEMEQSVLQMEIPNTYLLRPSIIMGPRKERRFGETMGKMIAFFIAPLMRGPLKKYKGIHSEDIAKAMINLNNGKSNIKGIIESDKIQEIANL